MRVSFNGNMNTSYITQSYIARKQKEDKTKRAVSTATQWFVFGIGLDIFNNKFNMVKSPVKKSLLVNSIVALGASLLTFLPNKNKGNSDNKINRSYL